MTRIFQTTLAAVAMLGLAACQQVLTTAGGFILEDRASEDQISDAKIGTEILKVLADKDKMLVVDLSSDVWEQRVLLTGTVTSQAQKQEIERALRADRRIREFYNEVQVVSKEEQDRRAKDKQDQGRSAGQVLDDVVIDTKIKAKLVTEGAVSSVNYRWRVHAGTVLILGAARTEAENTLVMDTIKGIEGVKNVKTYIRVRPAR